MRSSKSPLAIRDGPSYASVRRSHCRAYELGDLIVPVRHPRQYGTRPSSRGRHPLDSGHDPHPRNSSPLERVPRQHDHGAYPRDRDSRRIDLFRGPIAAVSLSNAETALSNATIALSNKAIASSCVADILSMDSRCSITQRTSIGRILGSCPALQLANSSLVRLEGDHSGMHEPT